MLFDLSTMFGVQGLSLDIGLLMSIQRSVCQSEYTLQGDLIMSLTSSLCTLFSCPEQLQLDCHFVVFFFQSRALWLFLLFWKQNQCRFPHFLFLYCVQHCYFSVRVLQIFYSKSSKMITFLLGSKQEGAQRQGHTDRGLNKGAPCIVHA